MLITNDHILLACAHLETVNESHNIKGKAATCLTNQRYFESQRTPSVKASNQALASGLRALEALYTKRKSSQMTNPPQATPPTNTLNAPREDKWELPPSPSIEFAPRFSARARSDTHNRPTISFSGVCDIVELVAKKEGIRVLEIYKDTLPVEHGLERPGPKEKDIYDWDYIVAAGSRTSRRQESEVVYLLKWRGYPYEEMSWVTEDDLFEKNLSALWKKHGRPQAGESSVQAKRQTPPKAKLKATLERKHPVQEARHLQRTIADSIPNPSQPVATEGVDLRPIDMVSLKTDTGKSASPTSRTVPSREFSGLPRGSGVIMNLPSANVYSDQGLDYEVVLRS
ncbi:hypothetical protein LTR96_011554 [Exophiala xenobiotica]|nr:hypothetical protein LTR72_011616 [Exophiala xenobiotica]KAK5263002.1 hypothetical protein LTR96_011554 [Exophiala xenobiotica]KAK5284695.1 hypothetical protein LTR14_011564 [Exophiala xenobiotica]KAK5332319.1 hypothetical protein LTR98_011549 [Exophiala xenobiotica]KAK5466304.1 hypothetical protein LTR55_011581 [Exophiala xenobiotica]